MPDSHDNQNTHPRSSKGYCIKRDPYVRLLVPMSKIREKNDFIANIISLTWLYHGEKTELVLLTLNHHRYWCNLERKQDFIRFRDTSEKNSPSLKKSHVLIFTLPFTFSMVYILGNESDKLHHLWSKVVPKCMMSEHSWSKTATGYERKYLKYW